MTGMLLQTVYSEIPFFIARLYGYKGSVNASPPRRRCGRIAARSFLARRRGPKLVLTIVPRTLKARFDLLGLVRIFKQNWMPFLILYEDRISIL